MNYVERALAFSCADEALFCILSLPDSAGEAASTTSGAGSADTGVVIIVGGPQYRSGSHRQFTLLARAITAGGGYPVLRFDYRGMGDSTGGQRNFEAVSDDVGTAIGELMRQLPGLQRVVLCGLCDGASAALMYLETTRDSRVQGVCIINPWVRSESGMARARVKYYYIGRLTQLSFWRKLLTGRVKRGAMSQFVGSIHRAIGAPLTRVAHEGEPDTPFQQRMAVAAESFRGDFLLILSENDLTAREFDEHSSNFSLWQTAFRSKQFKRLDVPRADHTFSGREASEALARAILSWLNRQCGHGVNSQA